MNFIKKILAKINDFKKQKGEKYYLFWVILIMAIIPISKANWSDLVFVLLLITFLLLKIPAKIPILATFAFLFLTALFLCLRDENILEASAMWAYYFLILGVIVLIKIAVDQKIKDQDSRINPLVLKKIKLKKLSLIFLFIITFILFRYIIFSPGYIEMGDLSFATDSKKILGDPWFLWNEQGSYAGSIAANRLPFTLANYFIRYIPAQIAAKILIVEIIVIGLISIFLLARKIAQKLSFQGNQKEIFILFSSFFYLFNPYALNRIFHFYHFIAYSILPLIFFLFLKMQETKKTRYALFVALTLNFISFSPHYLFYISLFLILWVLIECIFYFHSRKNHLSLRLIFSDHKKNLFNISILILTFCLFASFWLTPYLATSFTRNTPQAPDYFFNINYLENYKNISQPIIDQLYLNGTEPGNKSFNLIFNLISPFLPLILILPIIFKNFRNKYTLFFSIIGIIAAVISTIQIWFPWLYIIIIFHTPYLKNYNWIFRESNRINGLLAFSYSFLLGFFFIWILNLKKNQVTVKNQ